MRLTVETNLLSLVTALNIPDALPNNTVSVKRGDSVSFQTQFGIKFGDAVEIDSGSSTRSFRFGAKLPSALDGKYIVSNWNGTDFTYTKTGTGTAALYTFNPSLNTTKLNNLLGYDPEGFAEATDIRCVPDIAGSLAGKYFILRDKSGSVGVWFSHNSATIPAGASACTRQLAVSTLTSNDTAGTVATKLQAVLDSDAQFIATVSGSLVSVTDALIGTRTAATDGTTGFSIVRDIAGSFPLTMPTVEYVDLDAEIEWVIDGVRSSTLTFTLRVYFDVNQGSEGTPSDATPAYPIPGSIALLGLANDDTKAFYIGSKFRIVPITGGVKFQVSSDGTTWVETGTSFTA